MQGSSSNSDTPLLQSENTQPEQDFNYPLKLMCLRLQHFVQQIDILRLQSVSARVSFYRMRSNSVVNESVMVGRNGDKKRLMNMLLSNGGTSGSYNNIGVVAIIGVGALEGLVKRHLLNLFIMIKKLVSILI